MKKLLLASAAIAASAALPQAAQAANIMDTVTCAQTGSGTFFCDQGSNTVGAGDEFLVGNGTNFIGVDFGTGTLELTALRGFNLGGTVLEFTNLTNQFNSFSFIGSSVNDFDAGDITLANGVLTLDFIDTDASAGDSVQLAVGSVPEPATWAFMIIGFGAIGGAMRRQRKANVKVSYA
ncbi:PEPxxWA-CTERM sorting domain-containing protein [Parasphingorhabdus cellanae]|uniref:PEP-CTERM sorting domain-containing protein n=1 Tax=Parasphingorhabdus cellanae TaxID=2806553 RepID=A0ABX7T8I7_9SPHN|nr:PEPxxWA-CTERM sorting domain-containing protein [Parasphingorhabdus cellanae]QTD57067.1 PEP-CTERM sorting domain-containing protein [Parasphingorhabdus cellanae]